MDLKTIQLLYVCSYVHCASQHALSVLEKTAEMSLELGVHS